VGRRVPFRHDQQSLPPLPSFQLPTGPVVRPDVRAAVILDPFSELAFAYEWDQVKLLPGEWRRQLIEPRKADLLFVESAWQGNGRARGDLENLRLRAAGSREDYALIKQFQRRAEIAEAALKATQP